MRLSAATAALAFSLTASAAQAAPVIWTFDDLLLVPDPLLSDASVGAALGFGAFVYDSDITDFGAISVTTTPVSVGDPMGEITYDTSIGIFSNTLVFSSSADITRQIVLVLDADLTNAGGVVTAGFGEESVVGDASLVRFSTFATLRGVPIPISPVPLPAGLPLLAAALGGLAFLRKRRKA